MIQDTISRQDETTEELTLTAKVGDLSNQIAVLERTCAELKDQWQLLHENFQRILLLSNNHRMDIEKLEREASKVSLCFYVVDECFNSLGNQIKGQ